MALEGIRKADRDIYTAGYGFDRPKEIWKVMADMIAKEDRPAGSSLLDVGCAAGAFIHYLQSRLPGYAFHGMDVVAELLAEGRARLPEVTFQQGSVLEAADFASHRHDVVICNGTVQIFDDLAVPLANLLSAVKPGGSLYVHGLVNAEPIDLITRYRRADQDGPWEQGWNVFSTLTFERAIRATGRKVTIDWTPFRMPFPLPRQSDPMRAYTIETADNPCQQVNGAGLLINTQVMRVRADD